MAATYEFRTIDKPKTRQTTSSVRAKGTGPVVPRIATLLDIFSTDWIPWLDWLAVPARMPLMKLSISKWLLVGSICLFVAQFRAMAADEGKWEALFNGKDLAGWATVNDATFVVTNGNLRLVTGMGWLRAEKQYTDFVLEVEWRALDQGYDSGLFLRAGLEGKPWPKDGWQVNLSSSALGGLVKGYQTVVPAETPRVALNKWVKFRIEVRGKKVTLDVDGERAWEHEGIDATRGYIGIQAENKSFDFRNLRVQELK